jgi:hypothetical protein
MVRGKQKEDFEIDNTKLSKLCKDFEYKVR